jgi:hypothetical protein
MILAFIGRSPWPKDCPAPLDDDIDAAVVARSRRLAEGVFHGMVCVRWPIEKERRLVNFMADYGWKHYRPDLEKGLRKEREH